MVTATKTETRRATASSNNAVSFSTISCRVTVYNTYTHYTYSVSVKSGSIIINATWKFEFNFNLHGYKLHTHMQSARLLESAAEVRSDVLVDRIDSIQCLRTIMCHYVDNNIHDSHTGGK